MSGFYIRERSDRTVNEVIDDAGQGSQLNDFMDQPASSTSTEIPLEIQQLVYDNTPEEFREGERPGTKVEEIEGEIEE